MSSLRAVIIAVALAGATLGTGASPAAAATKPAAAPSLLFVQQTDGGTLKSTGASTFRLTLRGVGPSVAAFADRPARNASSEPVRRFIARWGGRGFADDPPNAALVMDGAPSSRDVVMLTLSHPRYHAATRTFTYVARAMKGKPGAALKAFHVRRDPARELRFGAASLFIDDAAALVAHQLLLTFSPVEAGFVYSLELTPYAGLGGGDVAFAPSTAARPSITILEGARSQPTTSTFSPSRISFTVDQADMVAGTSMLAVSVSFVVDPSVWQFVLRNVSPLGQTNAFYYPSVGRDYTLMVPRAATPLPWYGVDVE